MATRLYLPSSGTPSVSPDYSSSWNKTSDAVRRVAVKSRISSSMASIQSATISGTANYILAGQYVYGPLSAQTIDGTVKGQLRCLESATSANATLAVTIRVMYYSGGSWYTRGTLLAISASDSTSTPPEFAASLTNRPLMDSSENTSLTLSSVSASSGDYLVIEIGFRENYDGTNRSASVNFGDNSSTDLGENTNETTANNPWIEFSGSITVPTVLTGTINAASSVTGALTGGYHNELIENVSNGCESGAITGWTEVDNDGNLTVSVNTTPAVTNLLSSDQATAGDITGTTGGFSSNVGATLSIDSTNYYQGIRSIQVTTANSAYTGVKTNARSITGGGYFTGKVRVKAPSGSGTMYVSLTTNSTGQVNFQSFTPTGSWQEVKLDNSGEYVQTTGSDTTIQMNVNYLAAPGVVNFNIDECMIEGGQTVHDWVEPAEKYSGNNCLKLSVSGNTSGYNYVETANWAVKPSQNYTVSAQAKTGGSGTGLLGIQWYDSSQQYINNNHTTFTNTSYAKASFTQLMPSNAAYAHIYFTIDIGTGIRTIYGDEFMLENTSTATTWVAGRPSAVAHALKGTINAAAALTGNLGVNWKVTGTINAAATLLGNLGVRWKVTGTINNAVTVTGKLFNSKVLKGTINAVSEVTGKLPVNRPLKGLIDNAVTMTGQLPVSRPLKGTINAASGVTGKLATLWALKGTITQGIDVTGALQKVVVLKGTIQGAVTTTGKLGVNMALKGLVEATSQVTGKLPVSRPLRGTVNAVSGLTGNLGVRWKVTGTINQGIIVTGNLTSGAFEYLSGRIDAAVTMTGKLATAWSLKGTVANTTEMTGKLPVARPLKGLIEGATTITGKLPVARPLRGTINAASGVTGKLATIFSLKGTINAVSEVTGKLPVSRPLKGTIEAATEMRGALSSAGQIILRGTIEVASQITGQIRLAQKLSGTINAQAVSTGKLGVLRPLVGTIQGSVTMTGRMIQLHALKGVVAATSQVTGNLGVWMKLKGTIEAVTSVTGRIITGYEHALSGTIEVATSVSGKLWVGIWQDRVKARIQFLKPVTRVFNRKPRTETKIEKGGK